MKILVDTNIILDVLLKREPHIKAARIIMTKCAEREITGYMAAHSIPNIFYVLRKDYSQEECSVAETVDYIVTRNPADFKQSRVEVIKPDEFVKLL